MIIYIVSLFHFYKLLESREENRGRGGKSLWLKTWSCVTTDKGPVERSSLKSSILPRFRPFYVLFLVQDITRPTRKGGQVLDLS